MDAITDEMKRSRSARGLGQSVFGLVLLGLAFDLFAVLINDDWSPLGGLLGQENIAVRVVLLSVLALSFCLLRGARDAYTLLLFLLLIPTILQFRGLERRMVADGFYYFSYVQSFWKDFDLDFDNDYRRLGIADRPSLAQLTTTGHRRNIFSVGPAIFWSPFFLGGEAAGRMAALSGIDVNLAGNGPFHWNAVAVGSLLYGFAAVVLIQSTLRRYFSHPVAWVGAVLTWFATQLHWYMVYQPWMAHALGTFTVALFIWLWDRSRLNRGWRDALLLGVVGGLMASTRWQNVLFLLLPFFDWAFGVWKKDKDRVVAGLVLFPGFLLGLAPQLLAWQIIYGQLFLLDPPHGDNFMRYSRPFIVEVLFSSRHGLLTWTPVLWLGFLGLIPLLKKRLSSIWMMTFCLLLITYVNMCTWDWWAANSFSNRRFDGALPVLAFGIAASFAALSGFVARRPKLVSFGALLLFPLWTMLFMEQYHRHRIPIDNVVSFSHVAANSAEMLFAKVGYPFAWPFNLHFARAHDTSPAKFDTVVGRYFFFLHRVPSERLEVGEDDGGLIGDGFGRSERRANRWVRVQRQPRGRIFVPLERDEMLRVAFHLSVRPTPLVVSVKVNREPAGRFLARPGFSGYELPNPVLFRRGTNEVTLELEREGQREILLLDAVVFDLVDS